MNVGHKISKRVKHNIIDPLRSNAYFLSAKSSIRLLCKRSREHYPLRYPLLVVSGLQRSGTHLVDNLLKNHPQILSYYRELQIGYPNKYHWPDLHNETNIHKRFSALIPRNMIKHFLNLNAHQNFVFDFAHFRRLFLELEKANRDLRQRQTLDNFFTAYFNAYLNCTHSNFLDEYKYIVTTIPGLCIRQESIRGFFNDYPDGKMFVSLRDPYLWRNSALKHTKRLKDHGLKRYQRTLENAKWASEEYKGRYFPLSFDHLIKNTQHSIQSILTKAELRPSERSTYPSNFPYYANDNSTFGHKKTKAVLKDKIQRELRIPEDEQQYIKTTLYPLYREVMETQVINRNGN